MCNLHILRLPIGLLTTSLLAGVGCGRDVAEHDNPRDGEDPVAVSAAIMVDPAPVQVPVPGVWPAATFDGAQYLVVWEDQRTRRPILYGARVAADGTALDPQGFRILDPGLEVGQIREFQPVVGFDGSNFLVVTALAGQLLGVRVSPAGEVLEPAGFVIASSANPISRPSLVFDGEQWRVAWSVANEPMGAERGVYSARVTPEGDVLDVDGVRAEELDDEYPTPVSVSFDGSSHLLSWIAEDRVAAIRVGPEGTPIDASPIRIETEEIAYRDPGTAASFDGENHVIAWLGGGEYEEGWWEYRVMASRVSPERTVLDPDGIVLDTKLAELTDVSRMDIVAANERSVVVWSAYGYHDDYAWADLIGVLQLAADGTTSLHPADEFTSGLDATLAAAPDGGLLLWRDGDYLDSPHTPIVGTLLDATGVPRAGSVVVPAAITNRQELRAAAASEHGFFVLWSDTRAPTGEGPALFGARLAIDGTPLESTPMQFTDYPTEHVDAAFDGASYVVTWADLAENAVVERVTPAGERLGAELLEPYLGTQQFLDAASDGTHTLLLGQAGWPWGNVVGGLLLEQAGAVVGDEIRIYDAPEEQAEEAYDAQASFDGSGYLVVWHDKDRVFGQRLSKAGALEGQRFVIGEGDQIEQLAIGAGDGNQLVVWRDCCEVAAVRIDPDSQVHELESLVAALESTCCHTIAFDGQRFIVAWQASASEDDESAMDLFGAQVSSEGEVVQQFTISQEPGSEQRLIVVGTIGRVLAAYDQFVPGPKYDERRALTRLIIDSAFRRCAENTLPKIASRFSGARWDTD
jgi:hypothetical protein